MSDGARSLLRIPKKRRRPRLRNLKQLARDFGKALSRDLKLHYNAHQLIVKHVIDSQKSLLLQFGTREASLNESVAREDRSCSQNRATVQDPDSTVQRLASCWRYFGRSRRGTPRDRTDSRSFFRHFKRLLSVDDLEDDLLSESIGWRDLSTSDDVVKHLATEVSIEDIEALKERWLTRFVPRRGAHWGLMPANDLLLLSDAGGTNTILSAVDQAQTRVWLETYCLDDSEVARALVEKLIGASNRGADVIVCTDGIGSFGMPHGRHLKSHGVKVISFNPVWRPIAPLAYRNHRKLLIADQIAFVGSSNWDWRSCRGSCSKPYSRPKDLNLDVAVSGPIVQDLVQAFCNTLSLANYPITRAPNATLREKNRRFSTPRLSHGASRPSHKRLSQNDRPNFSFRFEALDGWWQIEGNVTVPLSFTWCWRKWALPRAFRWPLNASTTMSDGIGQSLKSIHDLEEGFGSRVIENCVAHVMEADGSRFTNTGCTYVQCLRAALDAASSSIVLGSSYFHPPGFLRRPLVKALRRGVPGTLLLSGLSDVPLDTAATNAILPAFMTGKANRCRAFFTHHRHCHLKCLCVDNLWTSIGSANWDRYSMRRNREIGLGVLDARFARAVRDTIHTHITGLPLEVSKRDSGNNQRAQAFRWAKKPLSMSLAQGVEEFDLTSAQSVPWYRQLVCILSYRLVRATGGPWFDGFTVRTDRKQ